MWLPCPRSRASDFPAAQWVVNDRTVVIDDVATSPEMGDRDRHSLGALGLRAVLASVLWCLALASATTRTRAEISLAEEVAEQIRAAIEHALAAAALRERETQFRSLFEAVDEAGFALKPVSPRPEGLRDWCFVAMNQQAQTMCSRPDLTGQSVRGIFLTRTKAGTPSTGVQLWTAIRLERDAFSLGMVLEMFVSPVETGTGDYRLMVVMQEVRARRRIAKALHRNAERQAFLLKLSDALRPLTGSSAVLPTVARLLGEHLQAAQIVYAEAQEHGDTMDVLPAWQLDDVVRQDGLWVCFADYDGGRAAAFRAGRTQGIGDISSAATLEAESCVAYASAQIAATIAVPLVKQGRPIAVMAVHDRKPRKWDETDISTVEEAAEKTWTAIERGRAENVLRASNERFCEFGDNSSDALWIVDLETQRLDYLSPSLETIWGQSREAAMADLSRWAGTIPPDDREAAGCAMPRLMAGATVVTEYRIIRPDREIRWIRDACFPIKESGIVKRGGGIAQDVTELREAQLRLQALMEEIPQLLWRASEPRV